MFGAEGSSRIELVKFAENTFFGRSSYVPKDGKVVSGECCNKIIDDDHFEVTEVLDGNTRVMHFHRVK